MGESFLKLIIPFIVTPVLLIILWRIRLKKLATYNSALLGKIEVFEKYNGERVLTFNNYPQGLSHDKKDIEKSYWYTVAEQTVTYCKSRKNPEILMFGLGACTIPNLIKKLSKGPTLYQTIVEFDPLVVKACEDFFGLKDIPNCKIVLADAYKLVEGSDPFGKKFDCVISDIYVSKPPFVVKKSAQPDFINSILKFLKKDGAVIFNWPAHNDESRSDGLKLKKYLSTLFKQTEIINVKDPRGFKNNIIIGKHQV